MCGEYEPEPAANEPIPGSPPHVWGILFNYLKIVIWARITPTCVGNAQPFPHSRPIAGDHPHMCGEYGKGMISHYAFQGSPPHVWGKHGL